MILPEVKAALLQEKAAVRELMEPIIEALDAAGWRVSQLHLCKSPDPLDCGFTELKYDGYGFDWKLTVSDGDTELK
jgi:hypothetical protein